VEKDFKAAWDCLTGSEKASDSEELSALLKDYGVYSAKDLSGLKSIHIETIASVLKPAQKTLFLKALNKKSKD
jgi:hypothetical protein